MMNYKRIHLTLLPLLLILVAPLGASNLNPGVVDLEKIRKNSPEHQRKVRNFTLRKQRTLNQLELMREDINVEIRKLRESVTNDTSDVARREKLILYRKLQTLKRRRQRLKQLLETREAQIEEQFRRNVRKTLKTLAKNRGLTVIYNNSSEARLKNILWAAPNRELTKTILQHLD